MRISKEMGVSHAEFLSALPRLFTAGDYRIQGNTVIHESEGHRVTFELGPEHRRTIGSMTLPATRVELSLEGFGEQELREFLDRFDLRFRRGGG